VQKFYVNLFWFILFYNLCKCAIINHTVISCMCSLKLFLKANVSVADIADYIISHNYIGSVIKVQFTFLTPAQELRQICPITEPDTS